MGDLDEIREKVRKLLEEDGSDSGKGKELEDDKDRTEIKKNSEDRKKSSEKKKGFFSRLFGRKD
jgi:hypothetical protein